MTGFLIQIGILFLPLIFCLVFTYFFWKSNFLSRFRLNYLWIFINSTNVFVNLFLTFIIKELINNRLFTEKSIFISLDILLIFLGISILLSTFFASFFWYCGFIHRFVFENRNNTIVFNLNS